MSGKLGLTPPLVRYADILRRDPLTPDFMHEVPSDVPPMVPVLATRYYDQNFFDKERRHLWSHVWQMACREEDIPNGGDYHIYEILDKSIIVARTTDGAIKAFYNSCLHRGRKLVTMDGCKQEFTCAFHGMKWSCDGKFMDNPMAWDFPQMSDKDMSLPEIRVDLWSGFVFVNFDPDGPSLQDALAPMIPHFERWDYASRYKAVHIVKTIRANWKAVAEAFMEAHHAFVTHPQLAIGLGDVNSQYDLLGDYVLRLFSPYAVPSPLLADQPAEDDIFAYFRANPRRVVLDESAVLPAGIDARSHMADLTRETLGAAAGKSFSDVSDAEMLDALLYHVFPNSCFWGGLSGGLCYRFRPNGTDPDSALMDVMILGPLPKEGPRPKPAILRVLGADDDWISAPEMVGSLAAVFDQDVANLPQVQAGLKTSGTGLVQLSRYAEMGIRHFHIMIDRFIEQGERSERTAAG